MATEGFYTYAWPRPMVTVDAVIFCDFVDTLHVLLVRRGNPPFQNQWAVPGGFLEMDEDLVDAATRELAEETGLTQIPLHQFHTFGSVGRDPRGRLITIAYTGQTTPDRASQVKAGDDAADAKWFAVDALPKAMAFDHRDMIAMALAARQ